MCRVPGRIVWLLAHITALLRNDRMKRSRDMQISEKKLQTNRRNARRSTGPRTKAGKKRSRWNAFRHGLTAKKTLLAKGESRKEYRSSSEVYAGT